MHTKNSLKSMKHILFYLTKKREQNMTESINTIMVKKQKAEAQASSSYQEEDKPSKKEYKHAYSNQNKESRNLKMKTLINGQGMQDNKRKVLQKWLLTSFQI
jgi:hypothetical protein